MNYYKYNLPKKKPVITAIILVIAALGIGYLTLGLFPSFHFSLGFVIGLVIWLLIPMRAAWRDISLPYYITLAFFTIHKVEEDKMNFFPELSKLTGALIPSVNSISAILLSLFVTMWLSIPFLVSKRIALGYFLAWTFFANMGIVELAHFVLPFYTNYTHGYFPGMWSVLPMASAAWWGISRLAGKNE